MATQYDSYLLNSTGDITVGTDPLTGNDLELQDNGEPGLTLSGIVDNGTTTISYAMVTLDDDTNTTTVYTDINGYYSIEVDPEPASYSINISKTGFVSYTDEGLTFVSGTSQVLDVTLIASGDPGNMIYGTVTDIEAIPAPLGDALVTVVSTSNEVVQFTQTNAAGEYSVYGLADATYTVIISKPSYAAGVTEVTVSATTPIAENNAALEASPATDTGAISGTITDATTTDPIAEAWVGLYTVDASDETLTEATLTDVNGNYAFTNLAAGTYVIKSKKTENMNN